MVRYSFFKHPNNVCMSYAKHMKLSLFFSKEMFKGSICSLVHAFIPAAFITNTSDTVKKLDDKLKNSGCR